MNEVLDKIRTQVGEPQQFVQKTSAIRADETMFFFLQILDAVPMELSMEEQLQRGAIPSSRGKRRGRLTAPRFSRSPVPKTARCSQEWKTK